MFSFKNNTFHATTRFAFHSENGMDITILYSWRLEGIANIFIKLFFNGICGDEIQSGKYDKFQIKRFIRECLKPTKILSDFLRKISTNCMISIILCMLLLILY